MESQAYIIALMLLIASPLAIASDSGQAVLEKLGNAPEDLIYDAEENAPIDRLDDFEEDISNDKLIDDTNTKDVVEDCYTLEQWKERLAERNWDEKEWNEEDWDAKDWEQEEDKDREESDGARGDSDSKKEKEDYYKDTDKVTDEVWSKTTDKDCFTEAEFEEFVDLMSSDEKKGKNYDCITVAQYREKWIESRGIDRDYERDQEGDNHDDEGEHSHDDDVADDHSHDDDVADNHNHGDEEEHSHDDDVADDHNHDEEEWNEIRAAVEELKEACEDGDEAACVELRDLVEQHWEDWESDEKRDWEQKDGDDSRCVPKHILHHMKENFGPDRGQKDHDRDYERDWDEDDEEWEELRAVMAELGEACDEGDEIACEELEELITELENDVWERDEDCDEHEDNEDDEDDSEDEEDDSENDEPEEA